MLAYILFIHYKRSYWSQKKKEKKESLVQVHLKKNDQKMLSLQGTSI